MGERHGDLEVLAPSPEEPGERGREPSGAHGAARARRRRWPAVAVLVAVTALAALYPVRDRIARGQLRWLERQWAQALADDNERISAEHHLTNYAVVSDTAAGMAAINADVAALYEEERGRFQRLRASVHHTVLVDRRLTAIRADMTATLAHWAVLLAGVAVWFRHPTDPRPPTVDNQTATGTGRVVAGLGAARAHWSERAPPPTGSAAPYASAAASLARLSRWLDQPTGTVLVAASGNGLARLDVDASRVTPLDIHPDSGTLVMRQGYLAFLAGGKAWAVSPDGSGRPRALAPAAWLFPADDPAAIWVVGGSHFSATEVDGTGRALAGPVSTDGTPQAAAAGVLVVTPSEGGQPSSQLEVWSIAGHRALCRLGTPGGPSGVLTARGNLLAWVDDNDVHVTDVTSCADRLNLAHFSDRAHFQGPVIATFSPGGQTLALASGQADIPGEGDYPLRLVDLATGRETTVSTRAYLPLESLVWTADGTRLFWLYGATSGSPVLGMSSIADQQSIKLRALNLDVGPPLVARP